MRPLFRLSVRHKEHREAGHNSSPPVPKSDNREKRQRQVGTEVHHLIVDVQTTDVHHDWRGCGQQGADDDAADEYGPEDHDEGAPRLTRATPARMPHTLARRSCQSQVRPGLTR